MITPQPEDRLKSLYTGPQRTASRAYTKFIRMLRYALPLAALGLATVVFLWPDMEETAPTQAIEDIIPDTTQAKNELVNPRYESMDADQQPFTVTAEKAFQDSDNPDLVKLSMPTADMKLKDGSWIAAKANDGIYQQKAEKLQLNGSVKLFHDAGYQLETEELSVNLNTREAFSGLDVRAHGPEGEINSVGLEARAADSVIIFKGPATMTLNTGHSTLNIGKAMP